MLGQLTLDFYKALGESKTLENLVLDTTQTMTSTNMTNFAKAIAMNKKKNGSLTHVSMRNAFPSYSSFNSYFAEKLLVSDKDHEDWYGDAKVSKEMKGEQLVQKFYFGLTFLDIQGSNMNCTSFKIKNFEKYRVSDANLFAPKTSKLFCDKATSLETLSMSKGKIVNEGLELYSYLLGKNIIGTCDKLKILDLSQNKIGSLGVKQLATSLETNKNLEFLDLSQNNLGVYGTWILTNSLKKNNTLKGLNLFKNTIDVDGARAVRELIKVNTSIEFLDIGHNRIRSKGLEAITQGIQNAKDCKIKSLGLRLNFINDDGFTRFFDESILSGMSKIENLYISQNNLTEYKASKIIEKLKE